jgi:cell division protein WhiA
MLSEDVRNELASITPTRRCDRLAELSALFHTAGTLHLHGRGETSLELDVASAAVARRARSLLDALRLESEIRTYRQQAFGRTTRYQLVVDGGSKAVEVLREAGVLGARGAPLAKPPRRIAGRRCCRSAYLRGALLGAGSVSAPPSAHLEVRTSDVDGAAFLVWLAGVEGIELRSHERRRFTVAYAKGAETIADALALAGASEAALALDEHAVVGAAKSHANRLANADHANIVRASRAAHDQLRAVRVLEAEGMLEDLPPALREAGELRLRYPSASLGELAAKARPPASKAGLHRRLRKLARMAEEVADAALYGLKVR